MATIVLTTKVAHAEDEQGMRLPSDPDLLQALRRVLCQLERTLKSEKVSF